MNKRPTGGWKVWGGKSISDGVNVLPMDNGVYVFTSPMFKVIYEEKIPVVTYVGLPNAELFKECKEQGIKIVYRSLKKSKVALHTSL